MPVLQNSRHERFAQEIMKGRFQCDAYRAAGYQVKDDATARANASRLLTNANIRDRIIELNTKAAEKTVLSKQWVLDKLIENVNRAMQAEPVKLKGNSETEREAPREYVYNGSVANKALELLGKELGMFIDRKEVGEPTNSPA